MADPNVRGRFVWHELWTPNRAGSHEFYEQAIGWRQQAWEHDESYSMFVGARGPLGGALENRAGTPQWLPYIATDDVDATVEAATSLGARIDTAPADLANAGRHAVLVDPHGAAFGVHFSATAADPEAPPAAGEFSWHELATNVAPEEAFEFYAKLFDWDEISRQDMGAMGVYLIFGRNGVELGGIFDKGAAGRPGAAYWLGYVNVDDLDSAVARAKAARASVLFGPMEVPGGDRIAQLMDPHGAFFALHARAAAMATASKHERDTSASRAQRARKSTTKRARQASTRKRSARTAARKPVKASARKKAATKQATRKKAAKKPGSARARKANKHAAARPIKRAAPSPNRRGKTGAKKKTQKKKKKNARR